MAQLCVAGHLHIEEFRARGSNAERQVLDPEPLEILRPETIQQFAAARLGHEGPFVHRGHVGLGVEAAAEALQEAALHEDFLGSEVTEQHFNIVERTLRYAEGARGNIQKCDTRRAPAVTAAALVERHGGQEVVLLLAEQVVVVGHTWCDEFRHAALDQLLGEFRIFQLVADGHLEAGLHQLGKIVVDGVIGNTGQRGVGAAAAGAPCQHDSQRLAHRHGVLTEGLVEVAHAVEEQRVRVLFLDGVPLRDERRFLCLFLSHTAAKVPIFLYICRTLWRYVPRNLSASIS